MGNFAIQAADLGKEYRIGSREESYYTLRDTLTNLFRWPVSVAKGSAGASVTESANRFWALRNVDIEVREGEVVGIIGPNGAGKTTLLKILSRITEPTAGWAQIRGQVVSLLEVGTGFHPELTGRENTFLNAAILGMRRAEIERKLEAIIAFAEVEKFIDTPVKHYSSGMYLRLAFAVAAHLEPEILMVDEVLAVGDAAFQKKCLGRMGEVAKTGRTVLIVSHNMAAIRQMADRVIVIRQGRLVFDGEPQAAIARYLEDSLGSDRRANAFVDTREWGDRSGTAEGRIVGVGAVNDEGAATTTLGVGRPFKIYMDLEFDQDMPSLVAGVELRTVEGLFLLNLRSNGQGITFGPYQQGSRVRLAVGVPGLPVYPGEYLVDMWFATKLGNRVDRLRSVLVLTFVLQGVYACERRIQPGRGLFLVDCTWTPESRAAFAATAPSDRLCADTTSPR